MFSSPRPASGSTPTTAGNGVRLPGVRSTDRPEPRSGPGAPSRAAERGSHRLYAQILWTTLGELPLVRRRRVAAIEGHLIALCRRLDVEPMAVSVTSDRVHLIVRFKPAHSLSEVASRLKGGSNAGLVRMRAPVRWGAGYAVASVGPAEVRRLMRELTTRSERFVSQGRPASEEEVTGTGLCDTPDSRSRGGSLEDARRRGVTRVLTRLPPPE